MSAPCVTTVCWSGFHCASSELGVLPYIHENVPTGGLVAASSWARKVGGTGREVGLHLSGRYPSCARISLTRRLEPDGTVHEACPPTTWTPLGSRTLIVLPSPKP